MATDDQDKAIREIAERHGLVWIAPPDNVEISKKVLAALHEACGWQREQDALKAESAGMFLLADSIRRGGQNG